MAGVLTTLPRPCVANRTSGFRETQGTAVRAPATAYPWVCIVCTTLDHQVALCPLDPVDRSLRYASAGDAVCVGLRPT